jgi:uridine kinase
MHACISLQIDTDPSIIRAIRSIHIDMIYDLTEVPNMIHKYHAMVKVKKTALLHLVDEDVTRKESNLIFLWEGAAHH